MSDEADLDALAGKFFGAFTTGPGCATRLDGLRELFLPQAVIVRGGLEPVVYDVDGFLAPRRALLLGGGLQEFREWETEGRSHLFGGLAQRFTGYGKEWVQDGVRHTGRGHKLLQLLRTTAGWRISALAWEDEPLAQA